MIFCETTMLYRTIPIAETAFIPEVYREYRGVTIIRTKSYAKRLVTVSKIPLAMEIQVLRLCVSLERMTAGV